MNDPSSIHIHKVSEPSLIPVISVVCVKCSRDTKSCICAGRPGSLTAQLRVIGVIGVNR